MFTISINVAAQAHVHESISIVIAILVSALILYVAARGSKFINLTITTVMSCVVGILLAAIAIQTILNGFNNLGITNL